MLYKFVIVLDFEVVGIVRKGQKYKGFEFCVQECKFVCGIIYNMVIYLRMVLQEEMNILGNLLIGDVCYGLIGFIY